MRLKVRKQTLAEIYSGMAKLLFHSGQGAQIESAPGKVRAVGTNHTETLVYEAEAPENETGEGTLVLPTDQLKEIVSAYGADTIIIFEKGEDRVIKAEWETQGLASSRTFQEGDEFPEVKVPGEKTFKPLDRERFRTEYLLCAECTTQDRARFDLDCIALDGETRRMAATDGRQIYEAYGVGFPWKDRCYLPTGRCFPEKLLLLGGELAAVKTKEILAFRNGAWTYSVKLKEANFAPVDQLSIEIGDTELLLALSEEDAARLVDLLPHLPGKERRSSAVVLKAEDTVTLHGESKGAEGEAQGQFALTSSHWIGGPFEVCFNREYFLRALEHGFRVFRFLPDVAPIVSETISGKYTFMPMSIREEAEPQKPETESTEETPEESQAPQGPTPAEVRKRRIGWLKKEALWLATRAAVEWGVMDATPSSSRLEDDQVRLQKVLERLESLEEKRKKKDELNLEHLLPPPLEMEWEELGRFERRDGTSVNLVRSKEGFYSLRDEDGEANVTLEDMAGLFEPLLAGQWKPFTLALYFNGRCCWIQAEFQIERTQKAARRSLLLGASRPARKEHLDWELKLHSKLLSASEVSTSMVQESNARIDQLAAWRSSEDPDTLDLLPLCMALAATA